MALLGVFSKGTLKIIIIIIIIFFKKIYLKICRQGENNTIFAIRTLSNTREKLSPAAAGIEQKLTRVESGALLPLLCFALLCEVFQRPTHT